MHRSCCGGRYGASTSYVTVETGYGVETRAGNGRAEGNALQIRLAMEVHMNRQKWRYFSVSDSVTI